MALRCDEQGDISACIFLLECIDAPKAQRVLTLHPAIATLFFEEFLGSSEQYRLSHVSIDIKSSTEALLSTANGLVSVVFQLCFNEIDAMYDDCRETDLPTLFSMMRGSELSYVSISDIAGVFDTNGYGDPVTGILWRYVIRYRWRNANTPACYARGAISIHSLLYALHNPITPYDPGSTDDPKVTLLNLTTIHLETHETERGCYQLTPEDLHLLKSFIKSRGQGEHPLKELKIWAGAIDEDQLSELEEFVERLIIS